MNDKAVNLFVRNLLKECPLNSAPKERHTNSCSGSRPFEEGILPNRLYPHSILKRSYAGWKANGVFASYGHSDADVLIMKSASFKALFHSQDILTGVQENITRL
jgi:hypothetical protein